MAKIPGWVYVIVGVAVALMSKWVESKTEPGQFKLFFWIGLIFIIIGIFKLIARYIFKMGVDEKGKKDFRSQAQMRPGAQGNAMHGQQVKAHHGFSSPHEMQHMQGQHHVSQPNQRQARQDSSIISCPRCNTMHYSYADFCMKCGTKMK